MRTDFDCLEKRGFATLSGVLRPSEISAFLRSLTGGDQRRSRAGIRHLLRHPAVVALAHNSRLLGIAQGVLGSSAFPFRATLFDKSPNSNWLIPWHQDTALPLAEKRDVPGWGPWSVKEGVTYAHAPAEALTQVLALRLHLDDCTDANGPLRALAGTHSLGVLSDDQILEVARELSAVECLVDQGGVLAMRPLLVHASSKSQSQKSRRVLHVEYAAKEEFDCGLRLALA
jgi:ectoine hydroxylase-related dioxygenase (phytanoyl-CoA dioxygenase family)